MLHRFKLAIATLLAVVGCGFAAAAPAPAASYRAKAAITGAAANRCYQYTGCNSLNIAYTTGCDTCGGEVHLNYWTTYCGFKKFSGYAYADGRIAWTSSGGGYC